MRNQKKRNFRRPHESKPPNITGTTTQTNGEDKEEKADTDSDVYALSLVCLQTK